MIVLQDSDVERAIAPMALDPNPRHQRSVGMGRLSVELVTQRTRIAKLYQQGSAKIRFPRENGDGMQAIVINSSGGMTGGDRLSWAFHVGQGASLTATTQACERIYKSPAGTAHTEINLTVESGGKLSWLPQETILYDQSALKRQINVEMATDSEILIVEPLLLGRKAMGETMCSGIIHDRWRVRCGKELIHAEDFKLSGSPHKALLQKAVTNGHIAMATILLIAPSSESLVDEARDILGDAGGASFWNGKLLARLVAEDGYALRKKLVALITLLNNLASVPKIWST